METQIPLTAKQTKFLKRIMDIYEYYDKNKISLTARKLPFLKRRVRVVLKNGYYLKDKASGYETRETFRSDAKMLNILGHAYKKHRDILTKL